MKRFQCLMMPRLFFSMILGLFLISQSAMADETNWIAVGSLHDWFSSAGAEIEVGRTHAVSDQQDGLRWPAQFQWTDTKASKALWIGAKNYNDPVTKTTFDRKVVHIGPRVLNEEVEIFPQIFDLYAWYYHPQVYVDLTPAGKLDYLDFVSDVADSIPSDRLLDNVVNTELGVTIHRKVYGFSNQNHDNYFIQEYVFTNTGIYNQNGDVQQQTLNDVYFYYLYRYAPTREPGIYGKGWLPQSQSWGAATLNDTMNIALGGNVYTALFSYLGKHSSANFSTIGGPDGRANGTGFLGAVQHVGTVVIHADKSAADESNATNQPATLNVLDSDDGITQNNDPFNAAKMTNEYAAMTAGVLTTTQADQVGNGYADQQGPLGGFSQTLGFGPYTLAPGEDVRIVLAEGVDGISRDLARSVGRTWHNGIYEGDTGPFTLPNGNTTTDPDEYKNQWVFTGKDSLKQAFTRAIEAWNSGIDVPKAPPPPTILEVNSSGDRIVLEWTPPSPDEIGADVVGYRVYRAIHKPDTTYEKIFECGPGTDHPEVVSRFDDVTAIRGFDYYYYVTSVSDGSANIAHPGVPLESSKFYTMTQNPAHLLRAPSASLDDIRIVPNPYNIRAQDIQFGSSGKNTISFYNLPGECTIKIYTERGDLIKTINHNDGSGDAQWDLVTSSRQVVVSGLYIAVVKNPQGEKKTLKFIVIR